MLGYREMLRGTAAQEWVIQSEEEIFSGEHDEVLVIVGAIGVRLCVNHKIKK